ncbi:MAG TPA: RsmE family RNA methyltransferase [Bryobacteraceae bacterium]|nr:RsmE family RNA methyltransferase [Bryobacteraceae bacterium]
MSRRRFFVPEVRNGSAELSGDEARHLTQVLRVEAGQRYEISDNDRVYLAEVERARKQQVVFRVLEEVLISEPPSPVTLLISLIKFERLELLLEKATELGVGAIQLVKAERSEKGLEQGALKRMARWQRIVLEAGQQSRRQRLPELREPIPFRAALTRYADVRIFLDEEPAGLTVLESLGGITEESSVAVFIGPEGGWPDHERRSAQDAGWRPVNLGPQILRTETAAISTLAVVNAVRQSRSPKQTLLRPHLQDAIQPESS